MLMAFTGEIQKYPKALGHGLLGKPAAPSYVSANHKQTVLLSHGTKLLIKL